MPGRLTTALRAATGVPRLYAAALRAGVGPGGAAQVVAISAGAAGVAARRGRGERGRQNAVRHFVWQALVTARFGHQVARTVAEAQESGARREADSRVDRHNNTVGQEYGAAHAAELCESSTTEVLEALAAVALEKWSARELVWVRPH